LSVFFTYFNCPLRLRYCLGINAKGVASMDKNSTVPTTVDNVVRKSNLYKQQSYVMFSTFPYTGIFIVR